MTELLAIDAWIFFFYVVLYRSVVVPRALAVFGLITVASHFVGIPLRAFLGYPGVTPMGMPMALSHLALAGWLMAKGFGDAQENRSPSGFHGSARGRRWR